MKERLCFLDIDGVLNTLMIYKSPSESKNGKINRDGYYYDLCWPDDMYVSKDYLAQCKTNIGFTNYEYAKACEILDRQLKEDK